MPLGPPKYIAAKPRRLTALAGATPGQRHHTRTCCQRHTSARYCMSRHTPSATQSTALAQTKHAVPLCEKSWLLCAVKLPQHPLCLRTPCVLHSRVNSVGLAALQPLPTKPTSPCGVANALTHEHTLLSLRSLIASLLQRPAPGTSGALLSVPPAPQNRKPTTPRVGEIEKCIEPVSDCPSN